MKTTKMNAAIYQLTFNADKMLRFILKVIYSSSESLEHMFLLIAKSLVFLHK